jgi:iron-sulfur cluster insertion protein
MSSFFITISDNAAKRIAFLVEQEHDNTLMLRVSVLGGGCSGFQYSFLMDDSKLEDDQIFDKDDAKVVIDQTSLQLLNGSQIDYVEDLSASSFVIKNPNAASSCGCGNSFSI